MLWKECQINYINTTLTFETFNLIISQHKQTSTINIKSMKTSKMKTFSNIKNYPIHYWKLLRVLNNSTLRFTNNRSKVVWIS